MLTFTVSAIDFAFPLDQLSDSRISGLYNADSFTLRPGTAGEDWRRHSRHAIIASFVSLFTSFPSFFFIIVSFPSIPNVFLFCFLRFVCFLISFDCSLSLFCSSYFSSLISSSFSFFFVFVFFFLFLFFSSFPLPPKLLPTPFTGAYSVYKRS